VVFDIINDHNKDDYKISINTIIQTKGIRHGDQHI
jgi:hypothetical protein